jgi:hypothetical protein
MAESSRMSSALQIGTTALVALGTGVMLYVAGTLQVTGDIDVTGSVNLGTMEFSGDPTVSGVGSDGSTQVVSYQSDRTAFTATGSLEEYTTFSFANPLSATGSIEKFCIEVAVATPHVASFYVDCGIVHDGSTATGTNLFDSEDLSVGIHCTDPGSTEVVFGPTQQIRCASLTGTGTGLSADGFTVFRETIVP